MPQLADAEELFATLERAPGVRYPVLVPNQRGLERALAAGADEIAVFVSATERFARENLGSTLDGAIEMAAPAIAEARSRGLAVRGYVSMCFGDPWEGRVDPRQPASVARRLVDLGAPGSASATPSGSRRRVRWPRSSMRSTRRGRA